MKQYLFGGTAVSTETLHTKTENAVINLQLWRHFVSIALLIQKIKILWSLANTSLNIFNEASYTVHKHIINITTVTII